MADNSPRTPGRKLGLIAPLSIAAAIAGIVLVGVLIERSRPEPRIPAEETPPAAAPSPPPAPPPDPVVMRADLVASANALASAYSTAQPDGDAEAAASLAGRRFTVRLPFGCEGPQTPAAGSQVYYEFDAAKRTVRLVARPGAWTDLPIVSEAAPAADAIEAAEGFWIARPWSAGETCPPPRERPLPATPTPRTAETLGLVQLFAAADSRVGRRAERPYEQVLKLGEQNLPPVFQGYRLVLEGRFATFPDGRVAHCRSESANHRPVCLYAVALDRVAFETGDGAKQLAEWRN